MCPSCRLVKYARVMPYHCQCGEVHWGDGSPPPPRQKRKPRPKTFGSVLRELVGCGCPIGWRKWDRNGLQWCRDNAEQIAQRLTAEPRPAIPIDRSRELVRQALRIAERSAETPRSPLRSQLSPDP